MVWVATFTGIRTFRVDKMKNIYIVFIAIIILSVSACAFHDKYPEDWKAITTLDNNECPNISGKYVNDGEVSDSDYNPSLSLVLFSLSILDFSLLFSSSLLFLSLSLSSLSLSLNSFVFTV